MRFRAPLALAVCFTLAAALVPLGCSSEDTGGETAPMQDAALNWDVIPKLDAETMGKFEEIHKMEATVIASTTSMPHSHQTPAEIWAATREGAGETADMYRDMFIAGICIGAEPLDSEQRNQMEAEVEGLIMSAMTKLGMDRGSSIAEYCVLGQGCLGVIWLRGVRGLTTPFTVTEEALEVLELDLDYFCASPDHERITLTDAVHLALMRRSEVPAETVDALQRCIVADPESWWRRAGS